MSELSLWAEWYWSQGAPCGAVQIDLLARLYQKHLQIRYPAANVRLSGLNWIAEDLKRSFLKLGYGGRTPKALHPQRVVWLSAREEISSLRSYLEGFEEALQAA